ncbi:hypothetical protein NDU88_001934 [Pleurodeles waltl]|uniref:Uncharacterized protein n=1 Tax=Pleurodeles waltl TaxID=8319 RepID=A0AAV7NEW7_PLEWA|nr:hypothetical protein NDU88_001934 [Pleurodeles waltl]
MGSISLSPWSPVGCWGGAEGTEVIRWTAGAQITRTSWVLAGSRWDQHTGRIASYVGAPPLAGGLGLIPDWLIVAGPWGSSGPRTARTLRILRDMPPAQQKTGPAPCLADCGCLLGVLASRGSVAGPGRLWHWPRQRLKAAVGGLHRWRIWFRGAPRLSDRGILFHSPFRVCPCAGVAPGLEVGMKAGGPLDQEGYCSWEPGDISNRARGCWDRAAGGPLDTW